MVATKEQRDLIDEFRETFPDVHTVEDTMRMCFQLKEDRDHWKALAIENDNVGQIQAGIYPTIPHYEQAVRGE